ncbi:uncharacterized protein CELE_C35E7.12 [Caenorhabditis elegans]|uniref:Uncharacterized protein n=1 Tax=Caenorhabditis elegans TaxID=6239 RepID=A0A2C9C2M9_CAEEL|nr:Uncharacterized protein CELE_C35E7.12 [Caenorhabditis elegans]SOF58710.1 Uncharacterized protein CELE_C35E7.12 [Caenorhabditis elegans]|eukprot:NP_001343720.1 Uncharacterized protein CELE_C35E7.12 [Caenorhabditis elegans]
MSLDFSEVNQDVDFGLKSCGSLCVVYTVGIAKTSFLNPLFL